MVIGVVTPKLWKRFQIPAKILHSTLSQVALPGKRHEDEDGPWHT